ncbi:TonB-dependent receptor [Natronogracilivirga saccharolytica]|uniref:TonB-dependent receptor n=1 Tax=Natronogracilivirga saccharolytica TaxID=2812953 RepID=A0A8J7RMT4_9BACT|nr:TonB-dependent receptor [Natronogracilivirga saccharolytica]MBP3193860.1 TonB-dependent receptor [Natronogracilivirga saccharolytica]
MHKLGIKALQKLRLLTLLTSCLLIAFGAKATFAGEAGPFAEATSMEEEHGSVTGSVVDASTDETLPGANVVLKNTSIGASTDDDGNFTLRRLPAGEQTLEIRYLGYDRKEIQVEVVADETIELNIQLTPDHVEGEEVIIHTQALGQARAIRQQLGSNTIMNVVSETRLRELPDANAAESIGRLPGVSVLRDAGEGQRIAIRGLGPEYSSITIDGNQIPGTHEDRSVDLSMISPDMLAGIEVYKTIRPDMDADAIGGSVNFRMGGAPEETQYRLSAEGGYNNHISEVSNYKINFRGNDRFLDNRLGVMVSANVQQVDRSSHELAANYQVERDRRPGEPHAPVSINTLRLHDNSNTRQRYSGGVSLDWEMENSHFFFNNTYNYQNRDEITQQRRYSLDNNRQEWWPRHIEREIATLNSTLAGQHDWNVVQVDWRLNRSVTTNETPYDNQARFSESSALDRSGVNLQEMPTKELPGLAHNRIERSNLEALIHQNSERRQENLTASLDLEFPVVVGRHISGNFKFGGKHYNNFRDRETTGYQVFQWEIPDLYGIEGMPFEWEVDDAGRALMAPFIEDPDHSYTILDGDYEMAFIPSISTVNQMWDDYRDEYRTILYPRFNDYEARERISSGYVMTELNIGPRLMILPGVRYEYEHSDYTAMVGTFQNNPEDIDEEQMQEDFRDSTESRNMGMWFPMVQARYQVTSWMDIRAARTVTTSRPSFGNVSPQFRIDYDGGNVNRANTQINPLRSTNYDLFLTLHHNRFGLFTVGAFYKEVEDVIYQRNANIIDPEAKGLPDNTRLFRISEPVNNENMTEVRGFEVEWQSNLTHLPSPFNGLVVNANYSRFHSEAHYHGFEFERTAEGIVGVDTFRTAPMVHQADHIANVSLGYDYGGFSARVSMQYQGATLRSIGSRPETDQYTDEYLRFDASIRQRFYSDQLHIVANLHNITNREDRASQFTYDRPRSIEYYGAAVDLGVEFRF